MFIRIEHLRIMQCGQVIEEPYCVLVHTKRSVRITPMGLIQVNLVLAHTVARVYYYVRNNVVKRK